MSNTLLDLTEEAPLPESLTITLKHPIEKRGKDSGTVLMSLESLTIRRPKARDMAALDKVPGDINRMLEMAARLSGEPRVLLDELDTEDFLQVAGAVGRFLPNGLKTGPI